MAVHVQHKQTMLILQHEKNFMDDYIRHFAQSDTGNGTIQYSFLRFDYYREESVQAATKDKETASDNTGSGKGVSENTGKSGLAAMCKGRWWLSVT